MEVWSGGSLSVGDIPYPMEYRPRALIGNFGVRGKQIYSSLGIAEY
jgi:hypothetical protein